MLAPLVCAVAVSQVVERIIPYQPDWNGWQPDSPRDLAHAGVNESLNLAGIALWSILAATVAGVGLPPAWPDEWPLAAQVVLAIVLTDIGFTLAHYASHRIGWLWRLHAVHHSLRRMYGFNGLMKHPLHQGIEAAAAFAPLPARKHRTLCPACFFAPCFLYQSSNCLFQSASLHPRARQTFFCRCFTQYRRSD